MLLLYVKLECDNKFVQCHTTNGKTRFKKSAVKERLLSLDENSKDQGTSNFDDWPPQMIYFKLNSGVNFDKLNYDPFCCNTSGNDSAMKLNRAKMEIQLCILKQQKVLLQ